jgi:hypothetical protein
MENRREAEAGQIARARPSQGCLQQFEEDVAALDQSAVLHFLMEVFQGAQPVRFRALTSRSAYPLPFSATVANSPASSSKLKSDPLSLPTHLNRDSGQDSRATTGANASITEAGTLLYEIP